MNGQNNIKKLWVVWYATFLHLIWGLSLITTNLKLSTTTIDSFFFFTQNPRIVGFSLCTIALLAFTGLFNHKWPKWIDCLMVLPQQFILIMSANGAINAIINSQFADGVIRPQAFIFCDQLPSILVAIFHTISILQYWAGDYIRHFFLNTPNENSNSKFNS